MIAVIVVVTLSIVFKGTAKVDKGFKLNYFKLSYRRKMIRTLTSLPVVILALIVVYFFSDFSILANIIIGLLLFLVFAIQLLYNFKMWRKMER
ncbi:ATPase [Lentibacillus salicampi]|uniref:ATPase n=1 Tax=Lentibacillus salicampi TaxID=175306 RepID=A0A4Y9AFJ2_9BACI|nr:ATPase [Lentibacillus salicampi]